MRNDYAYAITRKIVSAIGQLQFRRDGTDIKIASGTQTSAAGTAVTLATITVPPSYYAVIGDVDYYTTSATGGTLSISYTDPLTSNVVTRYIALAAASFIELAHDFEDHPFMAVFNSGTGNLTITLSTTTTTTSSTYIANAAYVLRTRVR